MIWKTIKGVLEAIICLAIGVACLGSLVFFLVSILKTIELLVRHADTPPVRAILDHPLWPLCLLGSFLLGTLMKGIGDLYFGTAKKPSTLVGGGRG